MILFKVNYVHCHFWWCEQWYCSLGEDRGGVKSDDCPISGESQRHGGPWSSYCLCLLISFLSTWLIKLSIVNKHLQAVPYLCIIPTTKLKQFSNSSVHSRATLCWEGLSWYHWLAFSILIQFLTTKKSGNGRNSPAWLGFKPLTHLKIVWHSQIYLNLHHKPLKEFY